MNEVAAVEPKFGEAAIRLHGFICHEREKNSGKRSSALEDVLQTVWSKIIHTTLDY